MRRMLLMPMLVKEFRTQLRGSRAALLITTYVGLTLIAIRLIYTSVAGQIGAGPPIFSAQVGQVTFIGLVLCIQALTVFLAPATTVNSISGEYERGTYAMLQATPLSTIQLLLGKLIAGLAFLLLLLAATLPLFSLVLLFGGIAPIDVLRSLMTILGSAVMGCMLGLLCSAITRQTYSATLLCYAILVAVIGGTLFAANLWSLTNAMRSAPPSYVVGNPLSAIASALSQTRPPDIVSSETLRPLVLLSLLTQGMIVQEGGERLALPLYRATLMLYGLGSLICFWLCLHLVQPRKRLAPQRADLVMLGVVALYLVIAWLARDWWQAGILAA